MWIEKEFLKSRDEKRKKKTLKGKFEGKEERKKVFFNRKTVTRINVGEVSAKEKMFFLFLASVSSTCRPVLSFKISSFIVPMSHQRYPAASRLQMFKRSLEQWSLVWSL